MTTPETPPNEVASSHERTIAVLVENKAGLLARVADLFARRGYNIVSLAVAPTHNEAFSRITIVVDAESSAIDQIVKQLFKLIHVVEIAVLEPDNAVERELLLATLAAPDSARARLLELVKSCEATVLDDQNGQIVVSLDGIPSAIDSFENRLQQDDIMELQRSGRIALPGIGRETSRVRAS